MTITNPDTIKEIANIINDGDKLLFPVISCTDRILSFHYKDTVIRIGMGNGKIFRCSDGTYELPDDFDNLVLKYFKKPHSKYAVGFVVTLSNFNYICTMQRRILTYGGCFGTFMSTLKEKGLIL